MVVSRERPVTSRHTSESQSESTLLRHPKDTWMSNINRDQQRDLAFHRRRPENKLANSMPPTTAAPPTRLRPT